MPVLVNLCDIFSWLKALSQGTEWEYFSGLLFFFLGGGCMPDIPDIFFVNSRCWVNLRIKKKWEYILPPWVESLFRICILLRFTFDSVTRLVKILFPRNMPINIRIMSRVCQFGFVKRCFQHMILHFTSKWSLYLNQYIRTVRVCTPKTRQNASLALYWWFWISNTQTHTHTHTHTHARTNAHTHTHTHTHTHNFRDFATCYVTSYWCKNYSPAAIIRNEKIWNIILLLAFFRTLSSNLHLEYPAVSEENCLKNLLPLPWPLISWEFRHFYAFWKAGGI